jgi:hypothetical protein
MNLFQRIIDALSTSRPPSSLPTPNGVLEMQQAMRELEPTTRALEERIRRPLPSVGHVMRDLRQEQR